MVPAMSTSMDPLPSFVEKDDEHWLNFKLEQSKRLHSKENEITPDHVTRGRRIQFLLAHVLHFHCMTKARWPSG